MVMFERNWEVNGSLHSIQTLLESRFSSDPSIYFVQSPRLIFEPVGQRTAPAAYQMVYAVSNKPLPNEPSVVIRLVSRGRKKTRIVASCESPEIGEFFKTVIEPMIEHFPLPVLPL